MKNLNHKRKPEPRNGVGSTALLGHGQSASMIIQGYVMKRLKNGSLRKVPVSLDEQLAGVKSSLNAKFLKGTVKITLKHFGAS